MAAYSDATYGDRADDHLAAAGLDPDRVVDHGSIPAVFTAVEEQEHPYGWAPWEAAGGSYPESRDALLDSTVGIYRSVAEDDFRSMVIAPERNGAGDTTLYRLRPAPDGHGHRTENAIRSVIEAFLAESVAPSLVHAAPGEGPRFTDRSYLFELDTGQDSEPFRYAMDRIAEVPGIRGEPIDSYVSVDRSTGPQPDSTGGVVHERY